MKFYYSIMPLALTAALVSGSSGAVHADTYPDGQKDSRPSDTTKRPEIFSVHGDNVHVSSSAPRTASAHGWWRRLGHEGLKANVVVTLQVKAKQGNTWHTVARAPEKPKPIKAAKKKSRKPSVTARRGCVNQETRQWRSLVDVDLAGVVDGPRKLVTKVVKLKCGV